MTKAVLAALAVGLVLAPAARAVTPHFHPCRDAANGARCGYVRVPLDRAAPAAKIRIQSSCTAVATAHGRPWARWSTSRAAPATRPPTAAATTSSSAAR